MNKPVLPPVAAAGAPSFTAPDKVADPRRKKKPGLSGDEAGDGAEGIVVAGAGGAAGAGAGAALLPGGGAGAGAAGAGAAGAAGAGGGLLGGLGPLMVLGVGGAGMIAGYVRGGVDQAAPTATNVGLGGNEDDPSIAGQGLGADGNGDTLTYSVVGLAPAGLTFNADGTFVYVPQAADNALDTGEVRTVTFRYVVNDGKASSAPATVTITLTGANDAPVSGGAATASGTEDDASIAGSVPAASDVDGETLTYSMVGATPAGLTFNADGTFSYVPQAADNALAQGESRTVTFDYKASDGTADSATATATITVTGVNDAPVIEVIAPAITPVAAGGEFRVNTATANAQSFPVATALADGGFVVTWQSANQDDVYAQRYAADGSAAGSEFRVNTTTASTQYQPAVTALADGFLVTWTSGGTGIGIYAQRYTADGTPVGSEFRVNTTTSSAQSESVATALADGGFVVTWRTADDGSNWGIFAQRYAADGTPAGSEFRVNTTISHIQYSPAIAGLADGGFVVTWTNYHYLGDFDPNISGQRFAADGTPVGAEFIVNPTTFNEQFFPAVTGLADGGFVVTWRSWYQDSHQGGIYGQRYAADGTPVGAEFRANTTTAGSQQETAVTALEDGGFLVTWQSPDQDGSGIGIYAQRYAADGAAVGGEFLVNTYTAGDQSLPTVAASVEGGILVAWQSLGQDGSAEGIYAQRFGLGKPDSGSVTEGDATNTVSAQLAVSDVDTSDTHTWSITPASPYGSMAIAADGTWTFTLDNNAAATQALTEGQVVTQTFTATVTDNHGASDTHAVTITITGSNDAPNIAFVATPLTPVPLATEFQINTTIAADQQGATVAALGNGGVVVIWEDAAQDGSGYGIYGRRFAADGTPAGSEFPVTATTFGNQMEPAVTALGDGGFLVTWSDGLQDGSGSGVYGQRFAADGNAVGGEFRINTYTTSEQRTPAVTTLADGSLVVAWQSRQDGSDEGIYAQRYAQDGSALGDEFRINTETARGQDLPALAALADGGFVATWRSYSQDEPWGYGIYGQRYAADGTPAGAEFRANTYTTGDQTTPVVAALADGGFVVAWQSTAPAGAGYGIFGQRYDADGVAVGGEFRMDTTTSNPKVTPALVALDDGGFLATWASMFQAGDGDSYGIFGQRFAADGTAAGSEFRVNTTTAGAQSLPVMALLADGSVQVVWQSAGQDGGGLGVFGQRLEMANSPEAPNLTEGAATTTASARLVDNDPDTSDTHAWSITNASPYGTMAIAADGTWTFTLDNNAVATQALAAGQVATQNFTATVTDNHGGSDTHAVSLTITGANDAPQMNGAVNLEGYSSDIAINGAVGATDIDNEPLTYSVVGSAPDGLTFNSDGTFSYAPQDVDRAISSGALRTFSFDVIASDGSANSAPATVTITVIGNNTPPIAVDDDLGSTDEDTALVFSAATLLGNDVDPDLGPLTVTAVSNALGGSVSLAGGVVTFTPTANYSGSASFEYTVSDGGATDNGLATFFVNAGNDAPVVNNAVQDSGSVTESDAITTASGQLGASDVDAGDSLTWSIADDTPASSYGSMAIAADGTWTYTLDNTLAATKALADGATATETFTATVTDGQGASDTHTVSITITGAAGGYQLGSDGVDDSFVASAGGDYMVGLGGRDQFVGQGGVDIFDGGAGDDIYTDLTASDDIYIYREGVDGFDVISESTNAGSDADELRILDASGLLYFSNMSADLLIETGSGPDIAMVLKDFFTYDYSGLSADIEQINVYSDSGSTLIASYTSQQIYDQIFP